MVKPFSPRELVARVRSVLRRAAAVAAAPAETIRAGGLEIDTGRMRVAVDGEQVELTATEFELLATLARQPGRVFTRGQLLTAIHGAAVGSIESYERAIDAHIKNLRRKLEANPREPRYILTVYGLGYKLADA